MARLPQPGGDAGNWGEILNEFLTVSHEDDGSLRPGSVAPETIQDAAVSPTKLATSNSPATGHALVYNGSALQWADTDTFFSDSLLDEDTMASNSATKAPSQQSVKVYVDTTVSSAVADKSDVGHVHAAADITSGTITSSRLPAATETTTGAVEIATVDEAVAGVDSTRAVTPAGVAAVVNAVANPIIFVDSVNDIPPGTPVDTLVVVRTV